MAIHTLDELLTEVKRAIAASNTSLSQAGVRISAVELTAMLSATEKGGAAFSLSRLLQLEIGVEGEVEHSRSHSITITFTPQREPHEVAAVRVSDQLSDGITEILAVVANAANGDMPMLLHEAKLELAFGVTAAGEIKFIISTGAGRARHNSLVLTLTPGAAS
jgi:hypothetical protein